MKLRIAVLALGLSAVPGQASLANNAVGVWLTDEGKAKVRLSECGDKLCSEIVWLREATDENGRPLRDGNNPDPRLRNRPIMGMEILQNLTPAGPRQWQGEIYNPENGKMYKAHLTVGRNELRLKGCVSWGWPCGEQSWTRVKDAAPQQQQASAAGRPQARAPQQQTQQTGNGNLPWAVGAAAAPAQRAPAATQSNETARPAPQARPAPAPQQPQQQVARAAPRQQVAPPPRLDGDDYLVQVAARQTENEALSAFSQLQQRFPSLLGAYQPMIQMADLGPKGVWYRVRVGPMDEKGMAAAFCEQLKSVGGDCIVRRHE